jgi:hypothetical protein
MKNPRWIVSHLAKGQLDSVLNKSTKEGYKPVFIIQDGIEVVVIWKKKWWKI